MSVDKYESEIKYLNEQLKNADSCIAEFENKCNQLSDDIIRKLCKRVIKKMNKELNHLVIGDYPSSFNYFDLVSIGLQSLYIDEVNPFLKEYIITSLDSELEKLSAIEKLVLQHCLHINYESLELDCTQNGVFDMLMIMIDEHYCTAKISNWEIRN